jgi:lipoic acid synthetase
MRALVHDLGRAAYAPTLALQEELVARVHADPKGPGHLVLVEHTPPVITLGRRTRTEHLLADEDQLRRLGIEVHASARGGSATWHGPGQLVAYPILRLARERTVRAHVRGLEEALLATLAHFGVRAHRAEGLTGVWVGNEKIAAIGVAVSHWIAWHGLALNVDPDLESFRLIVPCGIEGKGVTSMARLLGRAICMEEVRPVLLECLATALGLSLTPAEPQIMASAHLSASESAKLAMGNRQLEIPRPRLPSWLRRPIPMPGASAEVRQVLTELKLSTVCTEALCPNLHECFARRTATFMILGDLCTRACHFCGVERGRPAPPREDEPAALAEACARLRLRHVVITSVTRDDLPDGGAAHFARTIRAVKERLPNARVEVLTPDFRGSPDAVDTVLAAHPAVFSHNLETVARLQRSLRGQANFAHSLSVLAHAAKRAAALNGEGFVVKSGLMLGLGERHEEILEAMRDLRAAGCSMLTVGQYLSPSAKHAPVVRFAEPSEFEEIAREARAMGFSAVAAGPFVRSSYLAEEVYAQGRG